MLQIRGIIPPIITPLADDERVDEPALRRQIDRLLAGGVHGIYLLGSTGEQPSLRAEERGRVVAIARDAVGGRVPLVVGTMASSTARAVDNIAQAEMAGADAVAVTPPHYYPSQGHAEQVGHYRACAAAARVPVLIYNIPSTTKVMLSLEATREIAAIPNVVGIKDSSTDYTHFLKLLDAFAGRDNFACLVGAPPLLAAAVLFGAAGCVPGLANLDPGLLVTLYAAAVRRDIDAVTALQRRLLHLARVVGFGAPIACLKSALELMGVCRATACAPLQPVTPEGRERIAALLRELELM